MQNQLFGRKNYILMLSGVAVIFLGLILMYTDDSSKGDQFGFVAITLAPAVILIGFGIEFFAIMAKTEKKSDTGSTKDAL
jgi:uncharacterized membrane protein